MPYHPLGREPFHLIKKGLTKKKLYDLYLCREKSSEDIAKMYGSSRQGVRSLLKKHGIARRSRKEARRLIGNKRLNLKISRGVKRFYKEHPEHRHVIGEKTKAAMQNPNIREKMSIIKKEQLKDPKYRQRNAEARFAACQLSPNKLEKRIISIINLGELPFEFVGDGKVVLYGTVPDFIQCNGKKQIIEVFGDYWHRKGSKGSGVRSEAGRKSLYSKLGYTTLILWEHDIRKMTDGEIYDTIKRFSDES